MTNTELSRLVDQYVSECDEEGAEPTLRGLVNWHQQMREDDGGPTTP